MINKKEIVLIGIDPAYLEGQPPWIAIEQMSRLGVLLKKADSSKQEPASFKYDRLG